MPRPLLEKRLGVDSVIDDALGTTIELPREYADDLQIFLCNACNGKAGDEGEAEDEVEAGEAAVVAARPTRTATPLSAGYVRPTHALSGSFARLSTLKSVKTNKWP